MEYGTAVHVAAFAVIGYIATIFYLIAEGIAGGMQPPISYYYGAKLFDKISQTVLLAVKVVILLAIGMVVSLNLFPEAIIGIFIDDNPQLMIEALKGVRLHLFALAFDGIIFIATMYFIAMNQAETSLKISIANMAIQLPFIFCLPPLFGITGVWLSVPISNIVLTVLLLPLFIKELNSFKQQSGQQNQNV
ncbi:MATE family efflux transporter [Shewanella maritima]|uniref:MATE family efflux transporter n=1 Tax=Shewanella maritima TaxID=2520507 RepID=UPI0037370956